MTSDKKAAKQPSNIVLAFGPHTQLYRRPAFLSPHAKGESMKVSEKTIGTVLMVHRQVSEAYSGVRTPDALLEACLACIAYEIKQHIGKQNPLSAAEGQAIIEQIVADFKQEQLNLAMALASQQPATPSEP